MLNGAQKNKKAREPSKFNGIKANIITIRAVKKVSTEGT